MMSAFDSYSSDGKEQVLEPLPKKNFTETFDFHEYDKHITDR